MADRLIAKLCPEHLKVSGQMSAILGCICGQDWTTPRMTHLHVTSDGCLLGENEGDCGANAFLDGSLSDLIHNLRGVSDCVGLTHDERIRLAVLAGNAVIVHGSPVDWVSILV
jgi:hypothetical protein